MIDPDQWMLDKDRPWENRQRIVPLRTYSGKITYKHRLKYFTMKDVERILRKVQPISSDSQGGFFEKVFETLGNFLLRILTELGAFVDSYTLIGVIVNRILPLLFQPLAWLTDEQRVYVARIVRPYFPLPEDSLPGTTVPK